MPVKDVELSISIDWVALWLGEHIPAALEIYKDNRPNQIAIIAKACTPAQRKMVLAGMERISKNVEEIKAAFKQG